MSTSSSLTYLKDLASRREVKTFLISILIGTTIQIMCRQYLKNHPELQQQFEEKKKNIELSKKLFEEFEEKKKKPKFRNLFMRGGVVFEASTTFLLLTFLSNNALLVSIITGNGLTLAAIPTKAISHYLQHSFINNLPDLTKTQFIIVNGEKMLDQCDANIDYVLAMLKEPLSLAHKEQLTCSMFKKFTKLVKTSAGSRSFIICIVSLLSILASGYGVGYHFTLEALIQAIKEGRISKKIGRAIIRRLIKLGLRVNPDLVELVYG
jgi:hypothetical protein